MISTKELRAITESESSYEKCHISYRGYMSNEINAAREVLQKYKKVCSDSVKELRDKTDMPMSECCDMLRCLWRDAKLECIQTENNKLRGLVHDAHMLATDHGVYVRYPYCDAWDKKLAVVEEQMRELGIEVD